METNDDTRLTKFLVVDSSFFSLGRLTNRSREGANKFLI